MEKMNVGSLVLVVGAAVLLEEVLPTGRTLRVSNIVSLTEPGPGRWFPTASDLVYVGYNETDDLGGVYFSGGGAFMVRGEQRPFGMRIVGVYGSRREAATAGRALVASSGGAIECAGELHVRARALRAARAAVQS